MPRILILIVDFSFQLVCYVFYVFLFRPQGAISEPNEKTVHHPGLELDVVVGGGLRKSPWENGYTPCEEGKMKQIHCDKVERFWNLVLVLDGVQFHSVFLNTQKRTAPRESWEWVRATRAGKTYTTSWPGHRTSHWSPPLSRCLSASRVHPIWEGPWGGFGRWWCYHTEGTGVPVWCEQWLWAIDKPLLC